MAFTTVRIRVRKLNSHKPRSSYVTSILITNLTFPMFFFFFFLHFIALHKHKTRHNTFAIFFAQTEYIIRCYFSLCSISFVAFMREVNRSFSLLFSF